MAVASNGLEALEKIRKVSSLVTKREGQVFDCVLMDLEMPGEYG
jgi:CheY-like chemotaxis protein